MLCRLHAFYIHRHCKSHCPCTWRLACEDRAHAYPVGKSASKGCNENADVIDLMSNLDSQGKKMVFVFWFLCLCENTLKVFHLKLQPAGGADLSGVLCNNPPLAAAQLFPVSTAVVCHGLKGGRWQSSKLKHKNIHSTSIMAQRDVSSLPYKLHW